MRKNTKAIADRLLQWFGKYLAYKRTSAVLFILVMCNVCKGNEKCYFYFIFIYFFPFRISYNDIRGVYGLRDWNSRMNGETECISWWQLLSHVSFSFSFFSMRHINRCIQTASKSFTMPKWMLDLWILIKIRLKLHTMFD